MILIQIVLVVLFGFMATRLLISPNSNRIRAWKKIVAILFTILAVISILFPELLDKVAHAFGVGRGADLLLYALVVAFLAYVLNQYLRIKDDEHRFNQLARKIAILEADLRTKNK